jgi:hypothetical protein
LKKHDVVRRDEIEKLPDGFWITNGGLTSSPDNVNNTY